MNQSSIILIPKKNFFEFKTIYMLRKETLKGNKEAKNFFYEELKNEGQIGEEIFKETTDAIFEKWIKGKTLRKFDPIEQTYEIGYLDLLDLYIITNDSIAFIEENEESFNDLIIINEESALLLKEINHLIRMEKAENLKGYIILNFDFLKNLNKVIKYTLDKKIYLDYYIGVEII